MGLSLCSARYLRLHEGDDTQGEKDPLEHLARDGQLMAYRHTSFWQCMDTLREKKVLEDMWQVVKVP